MGRRGEDKTVSNSVKFEFDYNQEGRLIKMHNKKYGIWKTRYAENSRNIFEDWVRRDGEPVLFSTERGALEYMHGIEMKTRGAFTEFEVREVS